LAHSDSEQVEFLQAVDQLAAGPITSDALSPKNIDEAGDGLAVMTRNDDEGRD
jgi:hypothetical protein